MIKPDDADADTDDSQSSARADDCLHPARHEGYCPDCGACDHEVILNRACLACGTTALDPVALSPKPVTLVSVDRLRRR